MRLTAIDGSPATVVGVTVVGVTVVGVAVVGVAVVGVAVVGVAVVGVAVVAGLVVDGAVVDGSVDVPGMVELAGAAVVDGSEVLVVVSLVVDGVVAGEAVSVSLQPATTISSPTATSRRILIAGSCRIAVVYTRAEGQMSVRCLR